MQSWEPFFWFANFAENAEITIKPKKFLGPLSGNRPPPKISWNPSWDSVQARKACLGAPPPQHTLVKAPTRGLASSWCHSMASPRHLLQWWAKQKRKDMYLQNKCVTNETNAVPASKYIIHWVNRTWEMKVYIFCVKQICVCKYFVPGSNKFCWLPGHSFAFCIKTTQAVCHKMRTKIWTDKKVQMACFLICNGHPILKHYFLCWLWCFLWFSPDAFFFWGRFYRFGFRIKMISTIRPRSLR